MKLRHRHFVVLTVLLMIGVPIAWRLRPLNPTERKLVGFWRDTNPLNVGATAILHLTEDRSVDLLYELRGSWSASDDQITLRIPRYTTTGSKLSIAFTNAAAWVGLRKATETMSVEFRSPDRVILGGKIYVRSSQSWEEYIEVAEPQ